MEVSTATQVEGRYRSDWCDPLVLVVEDGAVQARLAQICLERAGYRVVSTPSGREALEIARAQQPALILLDVEIEELNGFQVLDSLRAASHTRSIPVIMLTAHAKDEPLFEEWASTTDAFMTKPFIPEELVATVRRSVQQAAA